MQKIFLSRVVLGIFMFFAWAYSYAGGVSSATKEHIQSYLNQWRENYHIPGVSISIILPGYLQPINFVSGTRTINGLQKITPDTLFQIDSITKVYTAVLILQLEEAGKLSISQTLGYWLPQYKQWKNVTIKQLLNMHSGIPSYSDEPSFNKIVAKNPTKHWTTREIINWVKRKPMLFKPGTKWNYSDINYILLGLIVEKASGKSYAQMLQKNIIKPLHLKHTVYAPFLYPQWLLDKLAIPYSVENKNVANINMSQAGAAGAIVASTQDTAIFFHALFLADLLKPKQLKEMLVPYSIHSGKKMAANPKMLEAWGVGVAQFWMPKEGLMWTKSGGFIGSFAQACFSLKDHVTIVLAGNKYSQDINRILPRKIIPRLYGIIRHGN